MSESTLLSTDKSSNAAPVLGVLPPSTTKLVRPNTKLLLVDFRSGEAVSQHPEIQSYLQQGWRIKSAVPRLVEAGGTRLLVVLTQPNTSTSLRNSA